MEKILPELMGKVIGRALVLSLVHAVFLRAAAQWIAKVKVPYKKAYGLTFLIAVVGGIFMTLFGFTASYLPFTPAIFTLLNLIVSLILVTVLATGVYGTAIKNKDETPIGIRKGFFTALVHMGLGLCVMGVVILVVFVGMKMIK